MSRFARPLLYLGTIAIVVGLGRYHAQFIGHYYFHSSQRLPWNLTYAGLLCLSAYGAGLPDLERDRSAWAAALRATGLAAVAISGAGLVLGSLLLPRFVVFSAVILVTPWFAVCVGLADIGLSVEAGRERVLLISGEDECQALEREMLRPLERPASLAGHLHPREARGDGTSRPLLAAAETLGASVVVLDRSAAIDETIVEQAAMLHERGLRVRTLAFFYDEWLGKLPLSELERMSLMFDVGDLQRLRYGRVKRLLDLAIALIGVVVLAGVLPFIVVGNLVGNRGPLFYRQDRVGRGQRTFRIVKFRTMRPGDPGGEWTVAGDARVTAFGAVLRRSHLDELPQVINIFRGEQSVVGPRPEQPAYVADLRVRIPFYDLRHLVRPGLTGWAQVKFAYGASEVDALEKLQYEFYYLRHQRLGLDVRIIGRTLRSVMGWQGR